MRVRSTQTRVRASHLQLGWCCSYLGSYYCLRRLLTKPRLVNQLGRRGMAWHGMVGMVINQMSCRLLWLRVPLSPTESRRGNKDGMDDE